MEHKYKAEALIICKNLIDFIVYIVPLNVYTNYYWDYFQIMRGIILLLLINLFRNKGYYTIILYKNIL